MDSWACRDCKSLNTARAKRCYKCNAPRSYADANAPGGAGGAAARVGTYRPANVRAAAVVILLGLTVALTAFSAYTFGASGGIYTTLVAMFLGGATTVPAETVTLLIGARSLLLGITAICWFFWFDRVIQNMPPLGAGWIHSSRLGAVVWWFVPIAWFVQPPRVVGDAYHRLAVKGTPGMWLVLFWWLGFVGAFAVPSVGARILTLFPVPTDRMVGALDTLDMAGEGMEIVSGVLAVAIVLFIQRAQSTRAASIAPAASASAAPAPGSPTAAAVSTPPGASGISFGAPPKGKGKGNPTGKRSVRLPLAIVLGIVVAGTVAGVVIARPGDRPAPPLPSPPTVGVASPSFAPSLTPAPQSLTDRFTRLIADPTLSLRRTLKGDGRSGGTLLLRYSSNAEISGPDGSSHVRIQAPQLGTDTSTDRIIAGETTYIRTDRGNWTRRPRTSTDRIEVFLGLDQTDELVEAGTARVGRQVLNRLKWANADQDFVQAILDSALSGTTVKTASGVMYVTANGVPVRMDMHVTATTGTGKSLVMDIRADYTDVGKAIRISAPPAGG